MNPKEVIEKIRADKFWIGRQIPKELQEGSEFQRRNTTNACKRLSEELYDKESHFVLELIQNADDNKYPDGTQPSLSFKIEPARIVVSNNEVGFAKDNVEALCQIGESTKVKENIKGAGYIGEKGIGFKSIFRVSSHPQIHSAGFHFFFKVDGDASEPNYICPKWIDDVRHHIKAPGTTIVLPAQKGVVFREDAYFKHIGPEILLFLRKLQALRVQSEAGTRAYAKKQLPNGISELSLAFTSTGPTTSTRRHFLVVEHTIDVKGLGGERRKNFASSKMHLAFGLKQAAGSWSAAPDQRSSLFAYLPVHPYGFRFIIQGDFLLTSSRGSVDFALPWNEALARSIPPALVDAVERFKTTPSLARTYYDYLPRPNEVTDEALEPLVDQIYSQLGATKCILSDSGKWRKPQDILLANDEDRALIPNSDLWDLLGKEYASKDLEAPKAVLEKLGCEDFSITHLFECLGHTEWVSKHDDLWFAELYRLLGGELDDDDLDALRKLPILRLADGKTTKYRDQTFLPLSLNRQYGFEAELQMLSAESSGTSDEEDEPIREFLHSLGVSEPSTELIIEKIVVPGCDTPLGKNGSASRSHLGQIRYLRDHWKQYLESKQKGNRDTARRFIASKLRLLAAPLGEAGTLHALPPDKLYFGRAYENECPLESVFGKAGISILSDCYIKDSDKDDIDSWRTFLFDLGVAAVPRVADFGNYEPSDEVKKVVSSSLAERRLALLAVVTKHWDRHYKSRSWLPTPTRPKRSSFFDLLSTMQVPVRGGGSAAMQETFVYKDDVYAAFKDTVKYIDLPPNVATEEVLKGAGVRTDVDFQSALLALKNAKKESKGDAKRLATLYQLISVYASAHQEQLAEEFGACELLFNPVDGTWRSPGHCFWESRSESIARRGGALSGYYSGPKEFFCDLLGVPEAPTLIQLHNLLFEVSKGKVTKADSAFGKQAYLEISDRLELDDTGDGRKEVLKSLSAGLVLARDGRFLPARQVLFDDDPELSSMFADHPKVAIMESDYRNLHDLQVLLEACSIRTVSSATDKKLPATSSQHRSAELTALVHGRWPELMRYLRHEGERQEYKRLKADTTLPQRVEVRLVENLRASYVLEGVTVERAERSAHQDSAILLEKAASTDFDRLSLEICRLLGIDQKEANFFYMILSRRPGENLSAFFDNRAIPPLPEDELASAPAQEIQELSPAQAAVSEPDVDDHPGATQNDQEPASDLTPTTGSDQTSSEDQTQDHATATPSTETQIPDQGEAQTTAQSGESEEWPSAPTPRSEVTPPADTTSTPGSPSTDQGEDDSEEWPDARSSSSPAQPPAASGLPRGGTADGGQRQGPRSPRGPSQGDRGPREHSRSGPFQQVYIAASVSGLEPPREDNPESVRLGDLGEDWVIELERQAGWDATRMPRNNKGYDIVSRRGQEEKFIEVKAVGGDWSGLGVAATYAQFDLAMKLGEKYWLYVVEQIENPDIRRCSRIQDPARKVTRFLFDDSWRQLIAQEAPDDTWMGCKVDLGDGRTAKVLRVRGTGQLRLLDVVFDDDTQAQVPFDPQKVRKI